MMHTSSKTPIRNSIPILEIYDHYLLTDALQLHQLRVAAVAELLMRAVDEHEAEAAGLDDEERRAVRAACLLHDMGNIVKFNLDILPELLEPEGREYWQEIQSQYIDAYGSDEYAATQSIIIEIGVPQRVQSLVSTVRFDQVQENYKSNDLARQITDYADMRVGPHGVISLEERIQEGKARWEENHGASAAQETESTTNTHLSLDTYLKCVACYQQLETELFSKTDIIPANITPSRCQKLLPSLRQSTIPSTKTHAAYVDDRTVFSVDT